MSETPPKTWTATMSGRERVRHVVELLDGPVTIQEIAERADVSRTTAADELGQLEDDRWVTKTTIDGTQAYDLNPVRMLFDEIADLIENNDREELEQQLVELTEERETLIEEYGARSLSEFRERLVTEELSAEELREHRNVATTWGALDTEINLVKHALQLYGDVTELTSPGTTTAVTS